jgi:hypothetical protein
LDWFSFLWLLSEQRLFRLLACGMVAMDAPARPDCATFLAVLHALST